MKPSEKISRLIQDKSEISCRITFHPGCHPLFSHENVTALKVLDLEALAAELDAQHDALKAEVIRDYAKTIYMNDKIVENLKVGGNKKPDNYRAEGWWQAYQALMQYAQTIEDNKETEL